MQHKVAEQIIGAMKGLDQAIGQLDISLRKIDDDDERRRMLRVLLGVYADAHTYIALPVVSQFPDLILDSEAPIPPRLNFRPGLPVRRGGRSSISREVTIHDERMFLPGIVAEDTAQDIRGQVAQVLAKIQDVLEANGSGRTRILSVLIFLAEMKDAEIVNLAWDDWIVAETSPARSIVQAKLRDPNAKIEIMAVAAL